MLTRNVSHMQPFTVQLKSLKLFISMKFHLFGETSYPTMPSVNYQPFSFEWNMPCMKCLIIKKEVPDWNVLKEDLKFRSSSEPVVRFRSFLKILVINSFQVSILWRSVFNHHWRIIFEHVLNLSWVNFEIFSMIVFHFLGVLLFLQINPSDENQNLLYTSLSYTRCSMKTEWYISLSGLNKVFLCNYWNRTKKNNLSYQKLTFRFNNNNLIF